MNEDKLIGWLCMVRLSFCEELTCFIPVAVSEALIAKGWLVASDDRDWDGKRNGTITPAGWAITDMHGPDWGIEALEQQPC